LGFRKPARQRPALELAGGQVIEGPKTVSAYLAETHKPVAAGSTPEQKALVDQWLAFAAGDVRTAVLGKNTKALRDAVRTLNDYLATRSYLALDTAISVADVAAWANLHGYMINLNKKQRSEVQNLTRWFDLVQHTAAVSLPQLPLIPIDLTAEPAAAAPAAAKGNKPADGADGGVDLASLKEALPSAAPKDGVTAGSKAEKKEKKAKEEKKPKEDKGKEQQAKKEDADGDDGKAAR